MRSVRILALRPRIMLVGIIMFTLIEEIIIALESTNLAIRAASWCRMYYWQLHMTMFSPVN